LVLSARKSTGGGNVVLVPKTTGYVTIYRYIKWPTYLTSDPGGSYTLFFWSNGSGTYRTYHRGVSANNIMGESS